nr:cation transporter [Actinomycetota bacterium]
MTCAACAARVERTLNKLDGVQATVNYATERARVQCPAGTDPHLLIERVQRVPLCDLSLAWSLFPELRFAGWQWLCLLLAAPVVCWCAWPFHRAALNGLRHRTSSMDTLVSVGVLASSLWSLWVLVRGGPVEPGLGRGLSVLTGADHDLYLDVAAGVTT